MAEGPMMAGECEATPRPEVDGLFAGPGELRALCREVDWRATPLGPVESWPQSLRTAAALVLGSAFPSILIWGPERVQLYNDAYAPLIGRKHPAALGAPTHACWPEIRQLQERIFERVFHGETVQLADAPYHLDRSGDGTLDEAFFTATFVPVPLAEGGVGGSVSTLFETTAQVRARSHADERDRLLAEAERARERLRRVLAEVPAGISVQRGPEHVFELVNPAYEALSGRRPLLGRPLRDAFPEFEGQGIHELHDRVYATGETVRLPEMRVTFDRNGDGTLDEGFFHTTWVALRDPDGAIGGVITVTVEVTEQVRQRERIEALRAEAEAASRAKSEFLAVMSHELRTPLNAIGGYAELMELGIRGPVTAQQREDLARIQRSQRTLLGLINEVLNYARLETGAVTYDITDVPVAEAVVAAEMLVAPQLRAKGLGYAWSGCDPGLAARADRDKLQQILLNLLSNAVKFTNAREGLRGRIEVLCDAGGDGADRCVRLSVRDTGVGIPADKVETVFEPFVQVGRAHNSPREGTGLGLAISRDLARGMDGDLTAESEVGVGSTFTLTLPAAG